MRKRTGWQVKIDLDDHRVVALQHGNQGLHFLALHPRSLHSLEVALRDLALPLPGLTLAGGRAAGTGASSSQLPEDRVLLLGSQAPKDFDLIGGRCGSLTVDPLGKREERQGGKKKARQQHERASHLTHHRPFRRWMTPRARARLRSSAKVPEAGADPRARRAKA